MGYAGGEIIGRWGVQPTSGQFPWYFSKPLLQNHWFCEEHPALRAAAKRFFGRYFWRSVLEMFDKTPRIPLSLKLAYTAFVVVHASLNWHAYGPLNFLWFCDIALLTLLVALWAENSLLASIAAVAILLPMALWAFDLAARITLGHYIFGFAGYMFDRRVPVQIRILSSFHLWVPVVLLRT